jgi:hypothetical protein
MDRGRGHCDIEPFVRLLDCGRERVYGVTIGAIDHMGFGAGLSRDRGGGFLNAHLVPVSANNARAERGQSFGRRLTDVGGSANHERGAAVEPEEKAIVLQPIFDRCHGVLS